jgi:hypothetical protein
VIWLLLVDELIEQLVKYKENCSEVVYRGRVHDEYISIGSVRECEETGNIILEGK